MRRLVVCWGARHCAGALWLRGLGRLRRLGRLAAARGSAAPAVGAQHPPRLTPAVAAPSTTAFGATVNTLFNAPLYTPDQASAQLAAFAATGATLARSDVLWEKIEPDAPSGGVHHYDWTFDDAIAGALAAHGLTWLPILDYAANWAKADPTQLHSPPRSSAEFADVCPGVCRTLRARRCFLAHPSELTPQPVSDVRGLERAGRRLLVPGAERRRVRRPIPADAGRDRCRRAGLPRRDRRPDPC